MQHHAAHLLLTQQNVIILTIEKSADAWYYVITARETKTNNKTKKEEKAMIATIVAGAVAGGLGLGLGYLSIYLFTKI